MADIKYAFGEMFADWCSKNERQFNEYKKCFPQTELKTIDDHPWYERRVEALPILRYRLPGDVGRSEFDWELLLKLLESSELYRLLVEFDDFKLVCRGRPEPQLKIIMYRQEKALFLMSSKEIKDLFYDLIDENIKWVLKAKTSFIESTEYDLVSEFMRSYWMYMAERINAKLKVSGIISGNEEIMKYVTNNDNK